MTSAVQMQESYEVQCPDKECVINMLEGPFASWLVGLFSQLQQLM